MGNRERPKTSPAAQGRKAFQVSGGKRLGQKETNRGFGNETVRTAGLLEEEKIATIFCEDRRDGRGCRKKKAARQVKGLQNGDSGKKKRGRQ